MLSSDIKQKLTNIFTEKLKDNVEIVLDLNIDEISDNVENLIKEIAETSDKIKIIEENLNLGLKPAIQIRKKNYNNFTYFGLPSGGEFQTFIESIIYISANTHKIPPREAEFVKDIDKKVNIKLFITKSCGWCPPTIKQALGFSILNKNVFVNVIDSFDFPEVAQKYNVSTVPKIVINDKVEFVGHRSENEFLGYIFSAVGS